MKEEAQERSEALVYSLGKDMEELREKLKAVERECDDLIAERDHESEAKVSPPPSLFLSHCSYECVEVARELFSHRSILASP